VVRQQRIPGLQVHRRLSSTFIAVQLAGQMVALFTCLRVQEERAR
jgi:hypothetical protein